MCSATNEHYLRIESLSTAIGNFRLHDISLSCKRGEYHILLGPTGSGKSSLIKCLLGLHPIQKGHIYLNTRDITEDPPERRCMGYLPQNYALFPHLNVDENIRFGLRAKKIPAREADTLMKKLCCILNIETLRDRKVRFLSGGEMQRVALGRALATQPDIILLDEPFSSIDEGAKRSLWFDLRKIMADVGVTVLHITHNLEEAYTLGQRLSILINGGLAQSGTNQEIFSSPVTESVARYLNYRNIYSGTAEDHREGSQIDLGSFNIIVNKRIEAGKKVTVCLRQQDIKIVREDSPIKDSLKRNVFSGEIVALFPFPESCLMWFRIAGSQEHYNMELKFPAYIPARHNLSVGTQVKVAVWEPNIIVF